MPCFNFVVEMVAAKPRATFRGAPVSSAAGGKEDVFWAGWEVGLLPELTGSAPTVARVAASPGAADDASVCGLFVPCVRALGSLVDLCMFIGFTVWIFKGAKFDIFQGSNLAS